MKKPRNKIRIAVCCLALCILALTVVLALGVGQDSPSAKDDAHRLVGVVVKRVSIRHGGVFLVITAEHGETKNVEVSRSAYARCSRGETYPQCAMPIDNAGHVVSVALNVEETAR